MQNISEGMASLGKVCVNLFYSRVGRVTISLYELNKSTLVYSQAKGAGSSRKARKYNNKSNEKQVKETVSNTEVRISFLPAAI